MVLKISLHESSTDSEWWSQVSPFTPFVIPSSYSPLYFPNSMSLPSIFLVLDSLWFKSHSPFQLYF